MNNQEIAAIFYEMADILEMQNIAWKPRAYRQAAGMPDAKPRPLGEVVSEFEMNCITNVLDTCGWNNTRAAKFLGVSRTTLIAKIRKFGISRYAISQRESSI